LRHHLGDRRVVEDVRGVGLMIGIEFRSAALAASFLTEMLDHHVIVSYSLNADEVVRLTPSVALSDADCERVVAAASASVETLEGRYDSWVT
jgi:putrescine aminotransferase